MKLGAFSISLAVKDLATSKSFYEKLGFRVFAGEMEKNYLIMKNGMALVGLFQGMFDKNILTFNPGWNESAEKLDEFDDVRTLHKRLSNTGGAFASENIEGDAGPGCFAVLDPDGNPVLIDQHV